MKFCTSSAVCCDVVCLVVLLFTLFSACLTAPLDTFYPTNESGLGTQRLQLLKDIRDVLDMQERNKQVNSLNKDFNTEDEEATGLMRVLPQKRFRPFRTQTRGGGVALCLWKVCPAAPWLVSKRR